MMGSPVHGRHLGIMTLPEQIWNMLRTLIRMHALRKR